MRTHTQMHTHTVELRQVQCKRCIQFKNKKEKTRRLTQKPRKKCLNCSLCSSCATATWNWKCALFVHANIRKYNISSIQHMSTIPFVRNPKGNIVYWSQCATAFDGLFAVNRIAMVCVTWWTLFLFHSHSCTDPTTRIHIFSKWHTFGTSLFHTHTHTYGFYVTPIHWKRALQISIDWLGNKEIFKPVYITRTTNRETTNILN